MPTIVILLVVTLFLILGLSVNTARAAKNYNSSKSNTSAALKEADIEDAAVAGFIKLELEDAAVAGYGKVVIRDSAVDDYGKIEGEQILLIDEDKMRERLAELGVTEEKVERAVKKVREGAAQEAILNLPKAGLTPSSPFYFLERWGEGIREFFTFSAEAKMKFHTERVLERIAEVKAMLEEKEVNPRGLDIALERLEKNVQKASEGAKRFFDSYEEGKSKDVSRLALELSADLENRRMALNAIFEEADEKRAATGNVKDKFPPSNDREVINKTFDEADRALAKLTIQPEKGEKLERPVEEETKPIPQKESGKAVIPSPPEERKETAPSAGGAAGTAPSEEEGQARKKDYNSSISNSTSVGKIREEIGNVLIRYGAGGAEINRVTDALEVGVDEADLRALLGEINISEAGIREVLAELERFGAKQK